MEIRVNKTVDAKGLACPMPIVRAKKAIDGLKSGEVMELQATDKGSLADVKAWAKSTGHHYLGSTSEGEILRHYIRKAESDEVEEELIHPLHSPGHTIGSTSLIVDDQYLLTGDILFVTSIGRPDLAGKTEDWVNDLRDKK